MMPLDDPKVRTWRMPVLYDQAFHRIHVAAYGPVRFRRVALCLHGYMENGRELDPLCRALAAAGWSVFCPDFAGHGFSDWRANASDYRGRLFEVDAAAVLALAGSAPVDVIGTSMGGFMAMRLAAIQGSPVRSLVISDAGAFSSREAMQQMAQITPPAVRYPDIDSAVIALRRVLALRGWLPADHWQKIVRYRVKRDGSGFLLVYDPRLYQGVLDGAMKDHDRWHLWNRVTVPTLLVRGEHSRMLPADLAGRMIEGRANAELMTIAGGGHPPWLRLPEQIDPIVAWLQRLPEGAR